MDKEHCYVFDHEDIDCLFYIGLQDIEEFNFRFELDEMMKKWATRLLSNGLSFSRLIQINLV